MIRFRRRLAAGLAALYLCLTALSVRAEEMEEWVDLDEVPRDTLLARDVFYHMPNENSAILCDHEVCFWKLKMGEMNESAIWQVLTQPVTVLRGEQREQVRAKAEPSEDCETYTGVVTCDSQAVHILERGEKWTLIEAYSSAEEGSSVHVFAEHFTGYVETARLQEKEVNQEYGIVIDKQQQRLYLFHDGKLFSTLMCSTGFARADTPWHETPAGEFLVVSWTGGFWAGKLYCDMALRINSGILLHEMPRIERTREDGTTWWDYDTCTRFLGEKASHGCIRIQKDPTPEGVNAAWLWNNLPRTPNVKVIIWDDANRELIYPDDSLTLYYNPRSGRNYHSDPYCQAVNEKYLPLKPFTYGELEDKTYKKLNRCPACAPQLRKSEIDTQNKKNRR